MTRFTITEAEEIAKLVGHASKQFTRSVIQQKNSPCWFHYDNEQWTGAYFIDHDEYKANFSYYETKYEQALFIPFVVTGTSNLNRMWWGIYTKQ